MNTDLVGWALTGLRTSVVAPVLLLTNSQRISWDRITLPAGIALPGFVVIHAAITLALTRHPSAPLWLILDLPLLYGALIYWLPIFSPTRRLSDPLRALYLFLSAPPLDLAGLIVIILGDSAGGLAMIAGCSPRESSPSWSPGNGSTTKKNTSPQLNHPDTTIPRPPSPSVGVPMPGRDTCAISSPPFDRPDRTDDRTQR